MLHCNVLNMTEKIEESRLENTECGKNTAEGLEMKFWAIWMWHDIPLFEHGEQVKQRKKMKSKEEQEEQEDTNIKNKENKKRQTRRTKKTRRDGHEEEEE